MTLIRKQRSIESGPGTPSIQSGDAPPPIRTRVRERKRERARPEPEKKAEVPLQQVSRAERTLAPEGWQHVHRAQYQGRQLQDEVFEDTVIAVPAFVGAVGHVTVDGSVTRNLGDFNSVKVRVSVSLPCYPEDSEVRRAYQHATNLIDELLPAELDKAMGVDGAE